MKKKEKTISPSVETDPPRMFSRKFFVAVTAVLILVTAGVWLGVGLTGSRNSDSSSDYSAVYLTTGDIYYGKLSWFPSPRLTNVWLLQRGIDQNNQAQLSVTQFTKAFWGPVDEINLNSRTIVFWTKLRSDSQLVKAFENPNLLQQPGQQQVSSSGTAGAATTTFRGPSAQPPSAK